MTRAEQVPVKLIHLSWPPAGCFEPRYNFNDSLQGYLGLSGESISFPNRAAAESTFYGGLRPTFGKLALDGAFGTIGTRAASASTIQPFSDLIVWGCCPITTSSKANLSFSGNLRQSHLHGERPVLVRR